MTDTITVPVEPTRKIFDQWAEKNVGLDRLFSPGVTAATSPFYYSIWCGGWDAAMCAAAPKPNNEPCVPTITVHDDYVVAVLGTTTSYVPDAELARLERKIADEGAE